MANDGSPSARGGGGGTGRRWCGTLTRVDLLIFLLAAALCSASYCLGIWHNSRGAADSSVLGPSAGGTAYCGDDDGEPLDFDTHHGAEEAGLSVSTAAPARTTTSTRRALRGAAGGSTARRGVVSAEAGGRGSSLRSTDAVAVQA